MNTALRVEGVAKQYRIYDHPSDRLKETLTRGWLKRHREFWALSDISFEIERGTTTGIVGPNGSGKSTLLQIITGTLEPTHGEVGIEGRVAALLELGAGFYLEFTGLENIYMNAALMNFSRSDTDARLGDIERFAEIGDFLHQPVKTYSSGMYVRLAFAIAVNTDPEILVVDEALSVGDTVFQHRCVRRIKEMQEAGTTVLFVSHDPAAVRALCSRAILLNAGQVIADGTPSDVLKRYQRLIMQREADYEAGHVSVAKAEATSPDDGAAAAYAPLSFTYRHGDGSAEIISAELLDENGIPVEVVETSATILVRMRVRFDGDISAPVFGFIVRNLHGIHIYGINTEHQQIGIERVSSGELIEVTFRFGCWLGIGDYSVSLAVHSSSILEGGISYDWLDDVLYFRVTSTQTIEGLVNLNADATARRISEHRSAAAAVIVRASSYANE